MNNFKNNNRRSRFKPNGDRGFRRNGNGHKNNGDFSNSPSFKRRHPGKNNQNASKLVEKYNDLAREALSNGDKILSENYLQHSEHFSRVLISQESSRNNIEKLAETNESSQINVENDNKEIEDTTTK
tara:strand:+ start:176 stop:556 length:381 start_codon:yes stop_codon:yes gene_type:complete